MAGCPAVSEPTLRVLSLGAGVQSSTLYLMAALGEFEAKPSVAIFADTQWEPAAVYEWLDRLETIGGHAIPIRQVTAGNLRADVLGPGRAATMPVFVKRPRDEGSAPLLRQCTSEYKIVPIQREIRRILGVPPRTRVPAQAVELWFGISLDEASRMRDSRWSWIRNRYPLIERGLTRHGCIVWLRDHGYAEPPKSACIGCPYHSNTRWRAMRDNEPAEWADAVAFDRAIRIGLPGVTGTPYLHRSLTPLDEVDLRTPTELGQTDLFLNECEGMCGV